MADGFFEEASEFLLSAGYQQGDLVRNCRFTATTDTGQLGTHTVDLVAFASQPHDMRSACVAAFSAGPDQQQTLSRLRYLTSPLAIVGHEDRIELWPIRKTVATQPFDVLDRATWRQRISTRIADYSPSSITAAKQDRIQLDFVDAGLSLWTKYVTTTSLKGLLEELLQDGLQQLPASLQDRQQARNAVLRLIFHLFACRVLEDKGVVPSADDPETALAMGHARFAANVSTDVLDSPYISKKLAARVFDRLRAQFSFDTLTTDILAHCYENALVTDGMRRQLGIFYTPPSLTEYILRRLPIEVIPQDERLLWDPCCGCGSFLLAGFDRLAGLLPEAYSGKERHRYLTRAIFGNDIDGFACELAALALVLTDLHNKNGWSIKIADVIQIERADLPRDPTIIVTNLPFKEIKEGDGKRRELSAEILIRLIDIAPEGAQMGVVLPQSFLDGRAARDAREKVLRSSDVLEVGLFPGGLFESATETVVLLLQRRSNPRQLPIATVRELRSANYDSFVRSGAFTRTYPADPAVWQVDPQRRFLVSPLADLWKRLEDGLPKLTHVADVRNGLQIRTDDSTSVSATQRAKHDRPYIDRLDVLRPFALLVGVGLMPFKWLKYGEQLHRARDPAIFEASKVLINSNRNPGSAWRLVAAMSRSPLYFSDNFHAVLSRGSVTIEQLAAVLNSPVANAWFDSRCRKRKVVQATLEELPFPEFDSVLGRQLNGAVKEMETAVIEKWKQEVEGMFYDGLVETADTVKLLAEIDRLVYDAYGLSRDERRHLHTLMSTDKRPS